MFKFPALYAAANRVSANAQRQYLCLIRAEYGFLFLAAVLALDLSDAALYFVVYAIVFLASLGVMITRTWLKPEQTWYKGRALAESIKTSSWRYCMRAEPFEDATNLALPQNEFRNHLSAILNANVHIGAYLPSGTSTEDQITGSMATVRGMSLEERKSFYAERRIRDQRTWYGAKSAANKRASARWVIAGIAAYAVAIGLVLLRIAYPGSRIWPIEPLIVVASSIIGWTQVKKFNELASSYALTFHEIGIIQGRVQQVASEPDFSNFVNEAEQAFSREHTQWVARQQTQ